MTPRVLTSRGINRGCDVEFAKSRLKLDPFTVYCAPSAVESAVQILAMSGSSSRLSLLSTHG
jgi:hypothetical protein